MSGSVPDAFSDAPAVVALGGGHGLAAALQALRRVTDLPTAVVTVADDGGSSGRLRRELGVLPPGDLRMALAALCGDDEWGRTWSDVVQHRFRSEGELHEHSVGNLLIVALWELLGDSVAGLDWVARLLGAQGRVLPMSVVPLDIEALVEMPGDVLERVRGQVAVATTPGRVRSVSLLPEAPPACPQAVQAVLDADWVVLGPGSWFTSVMPHLLVPDLAAALRTTSARRLLVLNLTAQAGETQGFSPANHLEVLARHAPDLTLDAVLADSAGITDHASLTIAAAALGADVVLAPLARDDFPDQHDPNRLADAFRSLFAPDRLPSDRI
ncbi:MAG: gluconeogenesis factor YvcK family protein [Pseudonocardia sp.]